MPRSPSTNNYIYKYSGYSLQPDSPPYCPFVLLDQYLQGQEQISLSADALNTWVNRGSQLKAKLQLAADVICRQPAAQ